MSVNTAPDSTEVMRQLALLERMLLNHYGRSRCELSASGIAYENASGTPAALVVLRVTPPATKVGPARVDWEAYNLHSGRVFRGHRHVHGRWCA